MTNGDYRQVEAYKNVIDWLNGRCRAFTDHSRERQVKADWSMVKLLLQVYHTSVQCPTALPLQELMA